MKNLDNLGVRELSKEDVTNTTGGFLGVLGKILIIAVELVALDIAMNPSSAMDALEEGWNDGYNN